MPQSPLNTKSEKIAGSAAPRVNAEIDGAPDRFRQLTSRLLTVTRVELEEAERLWKIGRAKTRLTGGKSPETG